MPGFSLCISKSRTVFKWNFSKTQVYLYIYIFYKYKKNVWLLCLMNDLNDKLIIKTAVDSFSAYKGEKKIKT